MATLKKLRNYAVTYVSFSVEPNCTSKVEYEQGTFFFVCFFISVQCLYITFGKYTNQLEYNFFEKVVCTVCIVLVKKVTIKALLCKTQYFYIVDTDM